MGDDVTVVYYTSNREYEPFEDQVKKTLLASIGDLPLISVSQKPIDFGRNICVGDIGVSELNVVRQLLTGATEAATAFVIPVESDCLYPPDFFQFRPSRPDTFYYAQDGYIIWHGRGTFYRKNLREFTSVVGREHLIQMLNHILQTEPRHYPIVIKRRSLQEVFSTSAPVVTIKTDRQMHRKHPFSKRNFTRSLPYWGTAQDLWRQYPCV